MHRLDGIPGRPADGPPCRSRLRDVPDVVHAFARYVTWLPVLAPRVEGLALIGPLLGAVVAGDHGPVALSFRVRWGGERRPILGALACAVRFAARVAVEDVQRHAFLID